MQDHPSRKSELRQRLEHILSPNIRGKIILPYLILTLVVAIIGTYVVTSLVASSLDERLTNQLLEAGRVVSDSLARTEINHLEAGRIVAFTRGLDEALSAHDQAKVVALAQPMAVGLGAECLIVVDAEGREMVNVLKQADGSFNLVTGQYEASVPWIVQALLEAGNPNSLPKRGLGIHPVNQEYYYFTAIPVGLGDKVVGVIIIGDSLNTLLSHFKATSLADVIVYLDNGQAIGSTFAFQESPAEVEPLLNELAISPESYQAALSNTSSTTGENICLRGRCYRLARGPLRVADDKLGVFAVVLPSNFIVQAGVTNRNIYSLLFTVAMVCVILVGYLVARRITRPLDRLVRTSHAVAEGDLKQRTGLSGADEIGVLAATFDGMTDRLAERTQALEQVLQTHKETATRLQAILASIGDGVVFESADGELTPLNASAHTLLKEMADNFLLGPLQELSAGEPRLASGDQPNPWLVDLRRFQIAKKMISVHSAAVRTDDGEYLGMVIVLRDVTAEVEADQLKDAFVAHVSHELRTPLTSIKGFSDLLLASAGDSLGEQPRRFLETISRNTDWLMEMVNGLLDFSEMEAKGRLGLQRRPMPLSILVQEVAAEWRPRMIEKGLIFEVEIAANVPDVNIDARRMHWAVVNLVRNAWQHTPIDGKVMVQLDAGDGQVILKVADTGVGISPEDQPYLFGRFYPVKKVEDEEARGMGLGLYVTKAIVEAHGGQVQVLSKEGVGSTFSVILPACVESK